MEFLIKSRFLPQNNTLLKNIDSAALRLYNKIINMDIYSLDISEYIENYFQKLLRNLKGTLQKYSYLLSLCFFRNKKPLDKLNFVDYGGGTGLFSLLAKELGVGKVLYNDIYNVSCHDAKEIANSLAIPADEYICGEIQQVIDYFKVNSINCDALGSFNVIEHIYDIEHFMNQLAKLSNRNLAIVLASGANPFNPLLKRNILKHHYEREFNDRKLEYGHKETDTLNAYTSIRKNLIIKNFKNRLEDREVNLLVKITRGLIEKDILKCVDDYLMDQSLPERANSKYPSNTCDPYTGNWAERLMDPYDLIEILERTGFTTQVYMGLHEQYYKLSLNMIGLFANKLMNLFPRQAKYLAPYYVLYGFKK
jgi:2-polyprenyl-3-methyl-5-hydroxy-6-metoxy-1,4-benzoquinol methylase